jgi:hypothetical protein
MKEENQKKFTEEYIISKEFRWDELDLSEAEVSDIPGATEDIQDAIGSILADTSTINFTYTDATPEIKADVIQSGLDHGSIGGLSDNDHPQYLLVADIDDTPVNGETAQPISSNWAFDHVAAADPHTGYVLESLVDAKGDLLVATAADTITRLAVGGTNGHVLTVDSAESTGMKWAAASGSGSGKLAQVVHAELTTVDTTTTTIPIDDTIPQNTEGKEFFTATITPTASDSTLIIEVVTYVTTSSGLNVVTALFQDSTASALAAVLAPGSNGIIQNHKLIHKMTAGTTSATTFKVRCGPGAGTLTINGSAGVRYMGGAMKSTITIWEVLA